MNQYRISSITGSVEYYTPPHIIEAARKAMGSIDLDPASCEVANRVVKAKTFYDLYNDGMEKEWYGNVWMNPPYARNEIPRWVQKLTSSAFVFQWICLTNNSTETVWAQVLLGCANVICFPNKRIRFWNDKKEKTKSCATQGQMITGRVRGINIDVFLTEFRPYGNVLMRRPTT